VFEVNKSLVIALEFVVRSECVVDVSDNGLKNGVVDRFAESITVE
jgi:hypothetical protein